MEPILRFRAWDDKNKKWAFEGFHMLGEILLLDLLREYSLVEELDLKITQWIGCVDMNGKDVYVGDRIEIFWLSGPTIEIISYDSEYGYYKYGNNPISEILEIEKEFQVIGHIYED